MMDENTNTATSENRSQLYEVTRKVLLATIGAAAIAAEEITKAVNHLAQRGAQAQEETRQRYEAAKAEQERAQADAATPPAEVDALNTRLAALKAELDALKEQDAREGEPRI